MAQHPEPEIRRAVRVLAMVGELHKLAHQRLRVMPFMSPSGACWRCWIGPVILFYRNHGALLRAEAIREEEQSKATVGRYTSSEANQYFGWADAQTGNARSLADKFLNRFTVLTESGRGWDYAYAGWYQRLLGLAEAGWMPFVLADGDEVSYSHIPLSDVRPKEWRRSKKESAKLPIPPPGALQQDYRA